MNDLQTLFPLFEKSRFDFLVQIVKNRSETTYEKRKKKMFMKLFLWPLFFVCKIYIYIPVAMFSLGPQDFRRCFNSCEMRYVSFESDFFF